ncbi:hypothetical protein BY996DRAFT_6410550 [Phakopsora pachyrhizi]|nr:hypothetical protein BY996DRAFT_6410550 [Phakopsora pachyrhizi]
MNLNPTSKINTSRTTSTSTSTRATSKRLIRQLLIPPSSSLLKLITIFQILTSLLLIKPITSQAINEKNQIYFGVWPDPAAGFSDTPSAVNMRLGFNVSAFQIAQGIPLPKYNYTTGAGGPAPEYLIEQTQTEAAILLTVIPAGFNVSDQDLSDLAKQLSSYSKPPLSRTVFLRFAPEMQGIWNPYGFQPTQFLALWRRMYQIIKAETPETAIVWAPNTPQSYPYGQTTAATSPEDLRLLDTNKDDYKGPNYQNINVAQPKGYCSSVLNGTSGTSTFSWYDMFCNKQGKACMISESGAAYHLQATQVAESTAKTALDLQRAWWQDCITSNEFFTRFPRIKMTMHFEHMKEELDGGRSDLRDYRITNDTATLEAFKADFQTVQSNYWVPGFKPLISSIPTSGRPNGSAPGLLPSPTGLVFQTQRVPIVTGPPSLFGTKRADATRRVELMGFGVLFGLIGFFLGLTSILKLS